MTCWTAKIRNVGLQVHSYSDGCKFEEAEEFCFRFKFDWSHHVSLADWVLDVSDEHQTRHLFCCECSQLVHVRIEADSLDCCKTCPQILTWRRGIWSTIWFRMWLEIARVYRLIFGQMLYWWEEYFRMLFQSGFCIYFWCSRKQNSVALCTAEAEYMVASSAAWEEVWIQKILAGLFGQIPDPTLDSLW